MTRAGILAITGGVVLLFGSVAFAQNVSLGLDQAPVKPAGDPNEGRMIVIGGLYGEQRIACVQCHGLDGAGNSSGAFPRLSGQSGWYLYKTLHDYAAGLRPSDIMGPIAKTLTDRQMQNVAAYYASIENAPSFSATDVDVSSRQIGGAIAATGIAAQGVPACNGCHGANGQGAPPIYPSLAGQFAPYTRLQLMLWKKGQRNGDPMNIMEIIAKAMTQEQIEAVSLYYAAVKPTASSTTSSSGSLDRVEERRATQNAGGISLPDTVGTAPPRTQPSRSSDGVNTGR